MKREPTFNFFALTFAALLTSCSPSLHHLWYDRLYSVDSGWISDSALWEISRDSNVVKEILKSAAASKDYDEYKWEEHERIKNGLWDTLTIVEYDRSDSGYVIYEPEPNPQLPPTIYGPNLPLFYGVQESGLFIDPPTPYKSDGSEWSAFNGRRFHTRIEIAPKGSFDFGVGGPHKK